MMNKLLRFSLLLLLLPAMHAQAQQVKTPDEIYQELFVDVQAQGVFPDGKTFVDCVPKRDPGLILQTYRQEKAKGSGFLLKQFVEDNFDVPSSPVTNYNSEGAANVKAHIQALWKVLQRPPDTFVQGSSLLPLPAPYIVPGGRFREIYYWDSYFTMLGLQESKEYPLMESMVKNFAYLIRRYGHVPNGNRSYYVSRSQPPFFALMVGLLAEVQGEAVFTQYLPALEKEYHYWMQEDRKGAGGVGVSAVLVNGALVNHFFDARVTPRQESYREDVETAEASKRKKQEVYNQLRAGAASGWDFSSRWFADGKALATIETTNIIPVDLNSLLFNLEYALWQVYKKSGEAKKTRFYAARYSSRAKFLNEYCWNEQDGYYYDYNYKTKSQVKRPSLATVYPLFFQIASNAQAQKVASNLQSSFLKPGGLVTTLIQTGQQWDAPNGWAPLQWMAVKGLENYQQGGLAREIAARWVALNLKVFHQTGKLMEKYNVVDLNLLAGGGEYLSQDGFGWTNGVLLKLMNNYQLEDKRQ